MLKCGLWLLYKSTAFASSPPYPSFSQRGVYVLSFVTTIIHLSNVRHNSPLYFESSLKPIKFEQKLNYTEAFRQTDVMRKFMKTENTN